jgi:ankyrin repeat protein
MESGAGTGPGDGRDLGDLLRAIRAGRRDEVERILDALPALLTARGAEEASPILLALYYRRPEIAEDFVRRGVSLDIFEASALGDAGRVRELLAEDTGRHGAWAPDGFFPLGLAAFFGRREAVAALLEAGADPNAVARNPTKVRPLHAAAAAHDAEIVRALLEAGADPNLPQQVGFLPLHEAASEGLVEMARMLVEHGARTDVAADDGKIPADFARVKGHTELASWLDAQTGASEMS